MNSIAWIPVTAPSYTGNSVYSLKNFPISSPAERDPTILIVRIPENAFNYKQYLKNITTSPERRACKEIFADPDPALAYHLKQQP
jgi:hypothetical protein